MKLSSRSWHYRLNRAFWKDGEKGYRATSLCTYFWQLVLSVLMGACAVLLAPFFAVAAVCAVALGIGPAFLFAPGWRHLTGSDEWTPYFFVALAWGLFITLAASLFLDSGAESPRATWSLGQQLGWIFGWLSPVIIYAVISIIGMGHWGWTHKPIVVRAPKARHPNLVVEFVKAKKRKFCPLIEVVED